MGLVVAFEAIFGHFLLTIDDSSGANIELKCTRKESLTKIDESAATDEVADTLLGPPARLDPVRNIRGLTATGHDINLSGIDIGSVIKIKGGICKYRGEKQVTLERIGESLGVDPMPRIHYLDRGLR